MNKISIIHKSRFLFIFVGFIALGINSVCAQVGMNTNNPDKSAALDISASNKGLLIPRIGLQNLTDTASIAGNNPDEGLLVYNTNVALQGGTGYYYWDGSKWQKIINTSEGTSLAWSTTGNAGTNPSTNYVGTSDPKDFQIKTNGQMRLTVANATGNVGVGTSPNVSSVLDLGTITTKGISLPQVALTSASDVTTVPSPKKGMMVYNTNVDQINTFDGNSWIQPAATTMNVVTPQLMAVASANVANTTYTGGNLFFDTKLYDPENATVLGTSTTNSFTYTVKQDGKHQIFLNLFLNTITAGQTWYMRVKKNGVAIAAIDVTGTSIGSAACLVAIDDFVKGDVITLDKGGSGSGWKGGSLCKVTIFRFQ